jgi:hypothetical protein
MFTLTDIPYEKLSMNIDIMKNHVMQVINGSGIYLKGGLQFLLLYPESILIFGMLLGIYLLIEIFSLYMQYQKDYLYLKKKMNVMEEENKRMKRIWEMKMNEEEYLSEAKYHQGIRLLQVQYDEIFAKIEQTSENLNQIREKMNKDDEWRGRVRNHIKTHKEGIDVIKTSLNIQEDMNGGFRNDIRILKGRITKLRTHIDKHLYNEDDEYVEVSE